MKPGDLLLALLANAAWAFNFLAGKVGVEQFQPLMFTALRFGLLLLALLPLLRWIPGRMGRIFEAVAQYESYTRAAEKLFMTQPAVSMQIKQLEEDSGLALFERQGKKTVSYTHLDVYKRQVRWLHRECVDGVRLNRVVSG